MVRTQIYLTEEERDGLTALAGATGKRQSELIREALDRYIIHHSKTRRKAIVEAAAGLWKQRTDIPDFAAIRKDLDRN